MTYTPHEETYKGLVIKIINDDSGCGNPRDDFQGTTFALFHNRYSLPNDTDVRTENFGGWDEVEAYLREEYDIVALSAVRGYDHGELCLSTSTAGCFSDRWDSGMAGFVFITRAQQEEMGTPDNLLQEVIDQDLEAYDMWGRGHVYGYVVETEDGEHLDSCWGYVGDYDGYVLEEARSMADWHADKIAEKRRQAATDSTIATLAAAGLA
jgi:hypothetical protein